MATVAAPEDGQPTLPRSAARPIAGRLFIVGCARSGTTLLQSFLAAHPLVLSFPETAVFGRLFYNEVPPVRAGASRYAMTMGDERASRTTHRRAQLAYRYAVAVLDMLGRRDLEQLLPIRSKSLAEFAQGFVAALDRLALDAGKSGRVAKTAEDI